MEEISLKEVIQGLLKNIKWILLITVFFTVLALMYGLLQLKVYSSEAALKVGTIDINPAIGSDSNGTSPLGDFAAVTRFPVIDINSYARQIVDEPVLAKTVAALGLQDADGQPVALVRLKSKITVRADEKAGILYITARDENAQAAADLANALAEQLKVYLSEIIRQQCDANAENIHQQMTTQQDRIVAVTEQLKAYNKGPNNTPALESLIESQITQIARYKSDLNDIERGMQADAMALNALREAIDDGTPSDTGVSARVSIPASGTRARYFNSISGESTAPAESSAPMEITIDSDSEIELLVMTVKKAELETRLVQQNAEYNALVTRLAVMEDELSSMTGVLTEEKQQYDILQREYRLAGEIYAQYQRVYRQIPVIASSDLAGKNLQILSHAGMPANPKNKSALFYAAVGGVLGLFAGVFVTLFKNYWTLA